MNYTRIIFFVSLFLICFSISCTTSRHAINIADSDINSQNLTLQLKDGTRADTIHVNEDDKVLWRIKTKNVKAIDSIADKPNANSIKFLTERKPHKKFLSRTWVLKVNQISKEEFSGQRYLEELYFIKWKPKGPGSPKTYDPLMQIYPR